MWLISRAFAIWWRDTSRRWYPSTSRGPSHGGKFFNDLLPLPYTKDTLDKVCEHINQVQEAIKRPILLENPSTYVAFTSSTMSETNFIRAVSHVPAAVY